MESLGEFVGVSKRLELASYGDWPLLVLVY
jgi:hypothetical protein